MAKGVDKTAILTVAASIADRDGLDAITMKNLAQELGVQPPSLYNHIAGLAELKHELMIFGWKELEQQLIRSAVGVGGWNAFRAMCRTFYRFSVEHPGVFNAMLWYNKYTDSESMNATQELFGFFYRFMESAGISRQNSEHILRTMRGFLEGFALLVNNGAFGHSASIDESFEISLEILIAGIQSLEGK